MPRMKNTNEDKEILFFSQIRKGQEIQIRSRAKVWRSVTQHAVLGVPIVPWTVPTGVTLSPSPPPDLGRRDTWEGAGEQDVVGGLVRMGSRRLFRGSAGFPQISLTPFPREPEGVPCLVGDCLLSFKQIVLMQEPSPAWRLTSFDLPSQSNRGQHWGASPGCGPQLSVDGPRVALLPLREAFTGLQLATWLPSLGLVASRTGQGPQTHVQVWLPSPRSTPCTGECLLGGAWHPSLLSNA